MTASLPRIAVAIPCYNAAPWIARTVTSALSQDCPGLRVIVVDDGSSDGSAEVIRQCFGDRVTLETGPNRGACHARNRGLALAREQGAEYVLFLDADDYLEGEVLAGAQAVAAQKDADMVLSDMHEEFPDGERRLRRHYRGHVAPRDLFFGWLDVHSRFVNPSGILWRRSFVERIGGWDESLSRAQDLDITLRAMLHDPEIWHNDRGAAIYARGQPGSITLNQSETALRSRQKALYGLLDRVRGTGFADAAPLLCRQLYMVAREAFAAGYPALGREIQARLRQEGHHSHHGTRAHRIAATLLGLERKTRLTGG